MPKINLFVYGTLKRGQRNHRLLAGQEFVDSAHTLPGYRLYYSGSYPCLVEDAINGAAVAGEIWRVDESCLTQLDRLEGAPALFRRAPIEVEEFTEAVSAYFYNGDVTGWRDCGTVWP